MRLRAAVDELDAGTVFATGAAHGTDVVVVFIVLAVGILRRVERARPVPLIGQRLGRGTVVLLVAPHLRVTETAGRDDAPRVLCVDVGRDRPLFADGCLACRQGIELDDSLDATGMVADTDGPRGILRARAIDALLEVPEIDLLAMHVFIIGRHDGTPHLGVDVRRGVAETPALGGRVRLVVPADADVGIVGRGRAEHGGKVVALGQHIVFLLANLSVLPDARAAVVYEVGHGLLGAVRVVGIVFDDGLLPYVPALHCADAAVGSSRLAEGCIPLGLASSLFPACVARLWIGVGLRVDDQRRVRRGQIERVNLGNAVTVDSPSGDTVLACRLTVGVVRIVVVDGGARPEILTHRDTRLFNGGLPRTAAALSEFGLGGGEEHGPVR